MTKCESLVSHVASKIIRHFLKKWKYPNVPFNVNIFSHQVLSGLYLFRSGMKGVGRIVKNIFKLKTRGRAILSEEDERIVIPIPARATIILVAAISTRTHLSRFATVAEFSSCSLEDLRSGVELLGKSWLFVDR